MSAANFITQQDFPLYALSDRNFYSGYCSDCGHQIISVDGKCPDCGKELENWDYDLFEAEYVFDDINEELNKVNEELKFYEITLKGGYYGDTQFYVEELHDSPENISKYWNNEDCRYQFDMCKSLTVKKAEAERRKVNKLLEKLAKRYGFEKLCIIARFFNGETLYGKEALTA